MANNDSVIEVLSELLCNYELQDIKSCLKNIKRSIENNGNINKPGLNYFSTPQEFKLFLTEELNQILETRTLERTHYYIRRLIKSLDEPDTNNVNDLNMNLWKRYDDILTDSLWIFDKRDSSGAHSAGYWGNFIPQIPNQLLRRFTKKGDWCLDTFLGSGTTLMECKRLGRNGIGVELLSEVVELAKKNLAEDENLFDNNVRTEIICADSRSLNYKSELTKLGINSVQFIIMHPPYWDIIKFSDDESDLSNSKSIEDFLLNLGIIIDNIKDLLDKGRYLALVIGDKYSDSEWIPLSFFSMQEILKRKFKLKSTIIKNFDETKGKMNQKELWRYRALKGGFYIFKHEYIFLFQKL